MIVVRLLILGSLHMIRVTQGYDIACAADAAMFEDRRRLFVDLMRWNVPVVAGRFGRSNARASW